MGHAVPHGLKQKSVFVKQNCLFARTSACLVASACPLETSKAAHICRVKECYPLLETSSHCSQWHFCCWPQW